MGKTGKWIKNLLLVGKKDKDKGGGGTSYETLKSSTTTKEKRRWNFRRSSKDFSNNSMDFSIIQTTPMDAENGHKKHSLTVAAAADASMAAEHAAAAVIHLTAVAETTRQAALEEAAAIKIQAVFRSHLARKAFRALKGLVKLQAIVKGHLVRKQAATTLRCMQALVTVQARARAHRILMAAEESYPPAQRLSIHRKSSKENRLRLKHIMDRGFEESIKVVEMDLGEKRVGSKRRNSYSAQSHFETTEQDYVYQMSPAASTLTEMSPRGCIGYVEVDNMSHNGQIHPNYMANTESSKAKTRSQSAPKQRSGLFERQSSRRKASNNVPRAVRMQRSSSHVGSTGNGYQFPWSTKLDQSTVSLKDSECGSSSTIISRTNYCKSVVEYELGNY